MKSEWYSSPRRSLIMSRKWSNRNKAWEKLPEEYVVLVNKSRPLCASQCTHPLEPQRWPSRAIQDWTLILKVVTPRVTAAAFTGTHRHHSALSFRKFRQNHGYAASSRKLYEHLPDPGTNCSFTYKPQYPNLEVFVPIARVYDIEKKRQVINFSPFVQKPKITTSISSVLQTKYKTVLCSVYSAGWHSLVRDRLK